MAWVIFSWALIAGSLLSDEPQFYTHLLVSDRVNGTHSNLETDLSPVQMGPLTIELRTTSHRLEVLEHELALGVVDERFDAGRLRARYEGEADVVAELELGGVSSEIEDHLVLPSQEIEVEGVIEIVRQENGFLVRIVENPEYVEIQVESNLADRLELLCRGFAVMAMGSIDCEGLEHALSVIKVPLPEPGQEFFVALSDLTSQEQRQIEDYLQNR